MSWGGEWYPRAARLPGPGEQRRRRGAFGASWWGAAWVQALEQRARLDPNRLPRGRTYARTGAVGALSLAPGEVTAPVQGSRRTPYEVRVRVRPFDTAEWERVLDALAAEIGHTAALLDGELPPEVAADVASVGLDLLPGAGELQPRCSCPDWADPCKHAAAVCYLVADALDEDPFGVLLLRGLGREEVLAALRARRHAAVTAAPPGLGALEPERDEGVLAREAWARWAAAPSPAELPGETALPRRAGEPTVLAADPPPASGLDAAGLRALAADAAARALELARGVPSSGLELSLEQDLARRAASLLPGGHAPAEAPGLTELARRAGVPARELLAAALAYRDGGVGGVAAQSETWDPEPSLLAAGKALLGRGCVARRNRVTLGERQLRLGRDARWYPYRKQRSGGWLADGPPLGAAAAEEGWGELEGD